VACRTSGHLIEAQYNDANQSRTTYESEVLDVLAYEFGFSNRAEIKEKVKCRLREKNLGPYDQKRIDILRRFKDEVQSEIGNSHSRATIQVRTGNTPS